MLSTRHQYALNGMCRRFRRLFLQSTGRLFFRMQKAFFSRFELTEIKADAIGVFLHCHQSCDFINIVSKKIIFANIRDFICLFSVVVICRAQQCANEINTVLDITIVLKPSCLGRL